ncbi:V-set domain-containing T-cell activation inhibitor 1-like isoform X3 [Triplophysa dalaica]|uniref:V-set domain-containing T-cell activation inhibitor 1-like isoform X3 n=1 Tax=Triplophysa dalaica TaxID=1582913 RepID=UPI0024DFA3A0|nr:V-set domain-containing T-cell activation inhibitor 1-like isoform X3 [Triplophysa dalaica]
MIISCCYIYALLVNIWTTDKVYSQVTIDGVVGGSVLLPCASNTHEHNLQDIDVLWRHNASMNVFTILKGKGSVEHQEPKYRNKTEFFPDKFLKGIFSIQLNKLIHTDAGEYECYILHSGEYVKVWLLINGR